MSDELVWMDGFQTAQAIRNREISPVEVLTAVLAQLDRVEPHINAFVTVDAERALESARRAEAFLVTSRGDELPRLFGVPITVKDLTDTAGVRTTYGSRAYASHVPDEDGVNWGRLKEAGAILVGKTTTPEFGGLGITESALTGITRNPWRVTHTAGGSSGGAAASVASGVAALAWGSDGGGSIRVPAACCGVVGLKASRGRIPLDRPWDSVSTEGPLTRTVRDAALLLDVTARASKNDPLSLEDSAVRYLDVVLAQPEIAGTRIAFAPAPAGGIVDTEVARVVGAAMHALESAGAHIDEIDLALPDPIAYFENFWAPGFVDMGATVGGEVDPDAPLTVHPAMLDFAAKGRAITAAEYLHTATVVRGEIFAGFTRVLDVHDLIIMPTMPVTAFPHPGEAAGPTHVNGIPVRRPAIDFHRFTESPSHAGLPAITIPCGFSTEGLPVGLQIVGPLFGDVAVLRAAAAIEAVLPWSGTRPALAR